MAEIVIAAKPDQNIWTLTGEVNRPFNLVPVVAWAVPPSGAPIPITVAGRLAQGAEYVLGCENGWMLLPHGQVFHDSHEVLEWLRSRRAAS
jgi:hypothetical protein